jgi:hypothetical protein
MPFLAKTPFAAPIQISLLLGATLLSACGNRLDTAKVEADIKADIERQGRRLSLAAVNCPTDVSRQTNGYFRCVGQLKPEGEFTINVVQTDSQGTVEWEVPNSTVMLNLAKVENEIQEGLTKAISKRALVDCGSEAYRANQAGDRFECQIVGGVNAGSDQINAVLVKVDPDGNLSWQEIRQSSQAVAAASAAPAGAAAAPKTSAAPPAAAPKSAPAVAPTTGNGVVERPYVPGDSD